MLLIGFRAKKEEVQKMDALTVASRRTRSDVMRVLLDQAELRPDPDIRLGLWPPADRLGQALAELAAEVRQ